MHTDYVPHASAPSIGEAYVIASDPALRTHEGITTIRRALSRTKATYGDHDGWLWAEEALTQIEAGETLPELWEKLAENLAVLPRGTVHVEGVRWND